MKRQNIIIIGAGAAGMMAAISAARNHANVTLLEHTDRIGKKILVTGNGRCNLTNLEQNPSCYRSNNEEFVQNIIKQFDEKQTLQFFEEIGIYTKDKNGYVYPYCEQASVVLEILKLELERLKINIVLSVQVEEIIKKKDKIEVRTQQKNYSCESLIIATGSKASPKTGSDGSGYELAKSLKHHVIKPLPALVQLRCDGNYFKSLAGIRCEANLRLIVNQKEIAKDQGELQLTDYGISGIPTFQISRYAVRELDSGKSVFVLIDFMPNISEKQLLNFITKQIELNSNKNVEDILIGLLNKKLVPILLKRAKIPPKTLGIYLKDKMLQALLNEIKEFEVEVTSFNSFEQAQVCSGGIDTKEVSRQTLESLKMPGVFFAGEILDVDGICGGYNLQWAWSSGYVAGIHASM